MLSYNDKMRIKDSLVSIHLIETDISFFEVFYPEITVRFPEPLPETGISLVTSTDYQMLKQSGIPDSLLINYKIIPEKKRSTAMWHTTKSISVHTNFQMKDIRRGYIIQNRHLCAFTPE